MKKEEGQSTLLILLWTKRGLYRSLNNTSGECRILQIGSPWSGSISLKYSKSPLEAMRDLASSGTGGNNTEINLPELFHPHTTMRYSTSLAEKYCLCTSQPPWGKYPY